MVARADTQLCRFMLRPRASSHLTIACKDEPLLSASEEFAGGGEEGAVTNKELSSSWDDIVSREALSPAEFCAVFGKRFEAGVSTKASTALRTGKKAPNSSIWAESYVW